MPYSAVPQAGQSLGATRDQLRNNIQSLKDSLAINHVDLDLANVGKHKFMQMPSQAAAPATAADELAFYVKTPAGVRLFLRQPSSGTEIQMSNIDPVIAQAGKTFLPGGLLLQWDKIAAFPLNSSATVNFGITYDAVPYCVQITPTNNDTTIRNSVGFTSLTTTQMKIYLTSNANGNADVYWMVIGKKA